MYRFEKLRVYSSSMLLVKLIYTVIEALPKEEKFGLADQLRRSSTSVVLNIAEGTGSLGDKEFRSLLRNALKSLYETVASLKIAEELFKVDVSDALMQSDVTGKELNALIKSLKSED